ncbi:hypothetical protein COX26_01325 [Candidatus Jorgensenbacteria bacterium CG23_combo_of_CG06-09_8_20_14_all_54_14]|uniref:Transcriptional repressor PaaX-like central Cas2-like domain-containing protein n=1 Tax=Candidatus Jorgensenbacteria bacterium CG23_combo_of_CG06-09_8_20_14_all_54_14 TaxID=1974595 RepID=A0A2G9Z9Y8_9BACT|nr:MAG: hypothetical protein COX26_01325 [Candidatus Jorgensenbacteria bacterium CG23_combo_of_CG06-09_8_20_14_all_54_14]
MGGIEIILTVLGSYGEGYRLMRRQLRGVPFRDTWNARSLQQHTALKETTLRTTLSRLHKRGLVENAGGIWRITERGRAFLRARFARAKKDGFLKFFRSKEKHEQRKRRASDMIVAFDIPERYSRKRRWLREELTKLGFVPLQKSVWVGPSPLPRNFIEALGELDLLGFIKFFRATQYDIV